MFICDLHIRSFGTGRVGGWDKLLFVLLWSPTPKVVPTRLCMNNGFRLKEGNVLFNDALNTFYLRLYGVRHMVKDRSDSVRGNPLPPHLLLFPISSKGSFICIIPHTG